jgi:hypothetical protein
MPLFTSTEMERGLGVDQSAGQDHSQDRSEPLHSHWLGDEAPQRGVHPPAPAPVAWFGAALGCRWPLPPDPVGLVRNQQTTDSATWTETPLQAQEGHSPGCRWVGGRRETSAPDHHWLRWPRPRSERPWPPAAKINQRWAINCAMQLQREEPAVDPARYRSAAQGLQG